VLLRIGTASLKTVQELFIISLVMVHFVGTLRPGDLEL